jgi:hypothetical protein
MSTSTTPPPSNVITPAQWQGPPWAMNPMWPSTPPPGVPPWPQPPSCFSELAQLNQCYNSVQMMEAILAKVMTDLVTNNTAVQQAIVAAIAASGSNVPLIGVTNGSNAQPGQVGEFLIFTNPSIPIPASQVLGATYPTLTLTPGDWDVWAWCESNYVIEGLAIELSSPVSGAAYVSNGMNASQWPDAATSLNWLNVSSPTCRVSTAAAVVLIFLISSWSTTVTTALLQVEARRVR